MNLESPEGLQEASLFTPAPEYGNQTAVLFLHGFGRDRTEYYEYAENLTYQLGATCLTLDLAGFGESEGKLSRTTIQDHINNASAAYSLLESQTDVDPNRIGVVGHSYGGYLAVMLSSRHTPESILLHAPANYEDREIDREIGKLSNFVMRMFRARGFKAQLADGTSQNQALSAAQNYPGKITVVESEKDRIVPSVTIDSYLRAAPDAEHQLIEGADHILGGAHRGIFKSMIMDWAVKL